jgi:hypothetical protein
MNTCIPVERANQLKDQLKKGEITADVIAKMLPEEKIALKSLLEDFVSEKLGVKVSNEEVRIISEKAQKIDMAQKSLGDNIGNPNNLKENLDFFKARKDMEDYLQSQSPAHKLKVLTGTIGRGMMLASVKSPILNTGSNIEIGFSEAIARRLSDGQFKGANNKLATDYVKMVNKIYQETGYDVSRMTKLDDLENGGGRVLGQTIHAQGPGKIRKVGRMVEDIVFKQLMGAPDVAFSSAHFADSANLNSLKMAKGDKTKATEWMNDAMRLKPQTPEGEILRNQAILDAQKATWTDDSWASKVSGGIRKLLNDVSGDARVGDYVLPFVKTPANVIATGMDYAGIGIPKALIKTYKAFKSGDLGSKEHIQSITRDLVRSGLGLTGAVIIANQLKDDDFVGAYDPARSQIESLRNSNYNAIRVGNKWISTDWLGPLTVPVTAMMYARKYGKTGGEKTFQYSKGVISSVLNIPGISDIYDFVRGQAFQKNQTLEEMTGATQDYITSQLYSRLVPSIISDVAKSIDPNVRQGGKGIQGIIAKIPFLSKTLPEKKNILGETIKQESPWSIILFGSRVKTDKDNAITKELSRISDNTDKGITFTDWSKSSSKTLAQFKDKKGQVKFDEAKQRYGQDLKLRLEKVIKNPTYQRLNDDQKLSIINGLDSKVMSDTFRRYGFKYQQKKSKPLPKL